MSLRAITSADAAAFLAIFAIQEKVKEESLCLEDDMELHVSSTGSGIGAILWFESSGKDIIVDYERATREDAGMRAAVEKALQKVCGMGRIRLGWAQPFYSRGIISRLATTTLDCCNAGDFDPGPNNVKCECAICLHQCPPQQRSGGQGLARFKTDPFQTKGHFQVSHDIFEIPDRLNIYYESKTIFTTATTAGLNSGSGVFSVGCGSEKLKKNLCARRMDAPKSATA